MVNEVFIVGSYRSGTTLLRSVLNQSPLVGIADETHYLRYRPSVSTGGVDFVRAHGDLRDDGNIQRLVDHALQVDRDEFWSWPKNHVPRERYLQAMLEAERTEAGLYRALMELYADGRPIIGDKTPAQVFNVPTLLEWFPNAVVFLCLRDPRAVWHSRANKPIKFYWQRPSPWAEKMHLVREEFALRVAYTWRRLARLASEYQARYGDRVQVLRYEDLVSNPRQHLQAVCAAVGIEPTEAMMTPARVNSSFNRDAPNQRQGFDQEAIGRWRESIPPHIKLIIDGGCGRYMQAYGYR